MTRTQTLPAPLVTFHAVALCDRRQHEVAIATDGQRAYVYPLDSHTPVFGATVVARVGVTLTAACPCPVTAEEQCDGGLTWRLDDNTWSADADARCLIVSYGTAVEQ